MQLDLKKFRTYAGDCDTEDQWMLARIIKVDAAKKWYRITYLDWDSSWDELSIGRVLTCGPNGSRELSGDFSVSFQLAKSRINMSFRFNKLHYICNKILCVSYRYRWNQFILDEVTCKRSRNLLLNRSAAFLTFTLFFTAQHEAIELRNSMCVFVCVSCSCASL